MRIRCAPKPPLKLVYFIFSCGVGLTWWGATAADPLPQQVEHPFRTLAAWLRAVRQRGPCLFRLSMRCRAFSLLALLAVQLEACLTEKAALTDDTLLATCFKIVHVSVLKQVSPDLTSADPKKISRGITVLSNSQSYVKSFDGMAYELKGKLEDGSSTNDIEMLHQQANLYESASSAKKVRKFTKLLVEVEKALNSAEVAEIASQFDRDVMAQYMKDAELRLLPTPPAPPATNLTDSNNATLETPQGENEDSDASDRVQAVFSNLESSGSDALEPRRSSISTKELRRGKRKTRTRDGNGGREGDTAEDAVPRKISRRNPRDKAMPKSEGCGTPTEGSVHAFVVTVKECEVQCLLMVDEREGRLLLAIGDALSGEVLLDSLLEEPAVVQLASHGLMRETAYVNRAAFQAACDLVEWAGPYLKASLKTGPYRGYAVHCAGHSFAGAIAACVAGILDGAIDVENAEGDDSTRKLRAGAELREEENEQHEQNEEERGRRRGSSSRPRSRRKKGSVDRSRSSATGEPATSSSEGEERGVRVRVDGAVPWVGLCREEVTCVTLGCPPCLSQNVRLPFVTSFVLGDDMVPRTSCESLRRLKKRLLQVMPKGKGFLSQGMAFSTSLFTDVAGVAMQGVRQATTSEADDARLAVPGKVWFAKPRRLKNGATLARVMSGSMKEDMLWQLHDIMLTKSMLSHHRLDKYVKILDRV